MSNLQEELRDTRQAAIFAAVDLLHRMGVSGEEAERMQAGGNLQKTESNAAWVSVADRMPEEGAPVVLYRPLAHLTQDPDVCIGWNTGRENESPQGVKHQFDCWCHPTHWLPLPPAPNDQAQGAGGGIIAGGSPGATGSTTREPAE